MSKFTQLQIHTHRVYGMAFPEVDSLISELYREQIGTWICYVDGWVPAGFVDRLAVKCVVDDFGNLVGVR